MRGPHHLARILAVCLVATAGIGFAAGPTFVIEPEHMAQDAFPEHGMIDTVDLGTNHIRFDMGRNISPPEHLRNDAGDSLVFTVLVDEGAVLTRVPRLHWELWANPFFDPYRTSGLGTEGWADCRNVAGSRWSADLPDSGFLYPGDLLHYHLEASQDLGGVVTTGFAPADTSGFSWVEPGAPVYDELYMVQCLPSLVHDPTGPQHNKLLFWYDSDGEESMHRWLAAYRVIQMYPGAYYGNFDIYATSGAAANAGNGLGDRATPAQLQGYDSIVYTCGRQTAHTLTEPDVGLIEAWLSAGPTGILLTGDHLASDLLGGGPAAVAFATDRMEIELAGDDLSTLIGHEPSPLVLVAPGVGQSVFTSASSWQAWAGVPPNRTFDAVVPIGGGMRLANFAGPDRLPGGWPYSAATGAPAGFAVPRVVSLPYDLAAIATDAQEGTKGAASQPARARVLEDVLNMIGFDAGPSEPTAVPDLSPLAVTALPNPFNPRTTIKCTVGRPGHLTVKVYDPRGRLVRVLADRQVTADAAVTWDGTDARGIGVAAGIYLYEVRLDERTHTGKLALVR